VTRNNMSLVCCFSVIVYPWSLLTHGSVHFPFLARLPPEEDPAVEIGHVPKSVEVGDEVLARWSDEGWYYRGNKSLFQSFAYSFHHVCNE